MIPIFILLSHDLAFISNAILEGEWSFNLPSTPSRLIFLPSHHHHLCSHHHHSLSSSCINTVRSPSPLLRDVGPTDNAPALSEARMPPHLPLPFPKGCGRARTLSTDEPKTEKDGGGNHEVGGQYEDTTTTRGGIDSNDERNGWQGGGRK